MKTVTYEFLPAKVGEIPKGRMHYVEHQLAHKSHIEFTPKQDFLGLVFNLKDKTKYLSEDETTQDLPKLHFNLIYVPQGVINLTLEKGYYGWFCVEFHVPYLRTIVERFPSLDSSLAKISSNHSVFLYDLHRPMTHSMITCVYEVVHCDFEGDSQNHYLEAKFVELMILCLSHAQDNGSPTAPSEEIEKIRAANEYIENNLAFKLEVGYLADVVGLPKRKLEEGFKQVFGTTVSDFVQGEKMKRAVILLRDTNMVVDDVASALGYHSTASFIRRFKNKFGCTPGQLRKKAGD
ncbi:AraC family transcriptional regulator [Fulvivirgaceae bacterium PWU4]|uniref:AraC family transcriptional regulator n=1 Tax=Chryseosolibacter histidini TaxID=2782349 RepID=A0AAP2GMA8_9BACT|nr:AraC family transcriptional regulator [Chryseosolibacter histidini]MBT1701049.1 AraC family transcriptional regulator [Chryseosolibacter histidini]